MDAASLAGVCGKRVIGLNGPFPVECGQITTGLSAAAMAEHLSVSKRSESLLHSITCL